MFHYRDEKGAIQRGRPDPMFYRAAYVPGGLGMTTVSLALIVGPDLNWGVMKGTPPLSSLTPSYGTSILQGITVLAISNSFC